MSTSIVSMKPSIWFVPSDSHHLSKNRLLLEYLREKECELSILSLDQVFAPERSTRKTIAASDYNLRVLNAKGFRSHWHWLLFLFQRHLLTGSLRDVFTSARIDCLILPFDTGMIGRTIVRVARQLRIPTILIPDGIIAPPNPRYRLGLAKSMRISLAGAIERLVGVGGARGTSGIDLILVMGERSRDQLLNIGIDPHRIVICGSPEYDDVANVARAPLGVDKEAVLRDVLGVELHRPLVLFAHQQLFLGRKGEQQLIRNMVGGCAHCGSTLVVKLHPRCLDSIDDWRRWAQQEGFSKRDVVFVKEDISSIDATRLCSACVTVYSTVAIEAMIVGRPVILVNYVNSEIILPYSKEEGAALVADSPEELQGAIVSAITDPIVRGTLRRRAAAVIQNEVASLGAGSLERMYAAISELMWARGTRTTPMNHEQTSRS